MARRSAFRGSYFNNNRPYITMTPDMYVSIQGQTETIVCGECSRKININRYVTGINTDNNTESPPGSASISLSIPDNDINEFYVDGKLVLISMMEIEIFSKGYYVVGGFPQYYRIFWGMISNVSKTWSNGSTTINISCKDMLRWWELTNITLNPAFIDRNMSSSNINLFQNQFSGMNPYTVIIALAKESMGDMSITTGSFTSFRPEDGPERGVIASFAKDTMAYWQLKFGNIWNSLVLYGTSGQAYTVTGQLGNISPLQISKTIFEAESRSLSLNPDTAEFKIQPHEVAAYKVEVPRAGEIDFFQPSIQSKLSVAMTCRDQAGGYEFYCDTTGDIIFKPPFYNLNVIPNKPTSWIQDFEIIEDSISESEQDVYTHITSSGNAFGGAVDWGVGDDITTPRTGVVDWHLLKRYGWRRLDVQVEWAGNPRKLFYHLLDWLDRINAKRESGSITIPLRPEIRMGFPVWIPKYDSFFYIQGVSHNFAPGGQATTTLTLIAKRSKFIAPKNIGTIKKSGSRQVPLKKVVGEKPNEKIIQDGTVTTSSYSIEFPSNVGESSGIATSAGESADSGGPAIIRDPKTGKIVGFPNVVMVYRTSMEKGAIQRMIEHSGSRKQKSPLKQDKESSEGTEFSYDNIIREMTSRLQGEERAKTIDKLRAHRYESGMTNAGMHDYAHDVNGEFKEMAVIPTDAIIWGAGTDDPNKTYSGEDADKALAEANNESQKKIKANNEKLVELKKQQLESYSKLAELQKAIKNRGSKDKTEEDIEKEKQFETEINTIQKNIDDINKHNNNLSTSNTKLTSLNMLLRPVSDEFGFEVIGHQRYGRGAFIDRGKVQLPDPTNSKTVGQNQKAINQLGIQFSPAGGLLTDNPSVTGASSNNFAELYEKMMPEEYVTGASFKGSNYGNSNQMNDIKFISQNTYTNEINSNSTRGGKSIFIEADALRRSKTLEEMSPTTSSGLDVISTNCNCGLDRSEWLTLLPQSMIRECLEPMNYAQPDPLKFSDNGAPRFGSSNGEKGTSISTRLQSSLQDASNGTFSPIKLDDYFDPSPETIGAGANAIDVAQAKAQADVNNINICLEAASKGNTVAFKPVSDKENVKSFSSDEFNSYISDAAGRIGGLNLTRESSESNSSRDSNIEYQASMINKDGFFKKLHDYLSQQFSDAYAENMERESYAKNAGRIVNTPDVSRTQQNSTNTLSTEDVLGQKVNELYGKAASGDEEALNQLQEETKFKF